MLTEIVEECRVLTAEYSRRSVVAHGVDRFVGINDHGGDFAFDLLVVICECVQTSLEVVDAMFDASSRVDFVELYAVETYPVAVGVLTGKCGHQFVVMENDALLHVVHHHFSRVATAFLLYFRRIERQHTAFRSDYDSIVVGDEPSCGSESVSVKHASGKPTVTEQ